MLTAFESLGLGLLALLPKDKFLISYFLFLFFSFCLLFISFIVVASSVLGFCSTQRSTFLIDSVS